MNLHVVNRDLCVYHVDITAVTTSSLFLIGDAHLIQLSSAFDTPPDSLIIGTFLTAEEEMKDVQT